jgi:hypothetical protein
MNATAAPVPGSAAGAVPASTATASTPPPGTAPARHRRWARTLALLAVVVVLLALVAATFALSYDGVRAIARSAGVPVSLARFYPGVLDAALVIACAAALLLRDGKWWARWYAWIAVIVIIAVAGATDAVHAMNVALPRRQTEGVVAAAPWVLVLLAFSLWLTILRQARAHRAVPGIPVPSPAVPVPGDPGPAPAGAPDPVAALDAPASMEAPASPEAAASPGASGILPAHSDAAPEPGPGREPAPEPAPEAAEAIASELAVPDPATGEAAVPRVIDPAGSVPGAEFDAPATADPQPHSLDYWDFGESASYEPPAGSGAPAEVHHSLAEPDAAAPDPVPPLPVSPFDPAVRLRRVRSTPVPPDEDEDDGDEEADDQVT